MWRRDHPAARHRGVATESLRQLTRWAFDRGMQRVTALISTDNAASSRVAEKVGMRLVERFRRTDAGETWYGVRYERRR